MVVLHGQVVHVEISFSIFVKQVTLWHRIFKLWRVLWIFIVLLLIQTWFGLEWMIFNVYVRTELVEFFFLLRTVRALTGFVSWGRFNINTVLSKLNITLLRRHHFLSEFVNITWELWRSLYNLNFLPMKVNISLLYSWSNRPKFFGWWLELRTIFIRMVKRRQFKVAVSHCILYAWGVHEELISLLKLLFEVALMLFPLLGN